MTSSSPPQFFSLLPDFILRPSTPPQKNTVFIHSQNHKLSSDAILHSKKSIWELMKKGKPPKIPKAMKPLNANDYKFMAMNVERDHKGQRQEDKKRKNVPRTVKFIEDVIDAFSLSNKNNEGNLRSSGVKPEEFNFKSLDDYIAHTLPFDCILC